MRRFFSFSKMTSRIAEQIKQCAVTLPSLQDKAFGQHFDSFGSYSVVLIGDASHGTSEFYRARAEITKRLIQRHGFNIVATEADWPDAEMVDRYVRQRPGQKSKIEPDEKPQPAFQRFPTWMWRNREVQDFVHWLRDHNAALPMDERAGFYGLDLYSLGASMHAVIEYLEHVDPKRVKVARNRYSCLEPWAERPATYGLEVLKGKIDPCEERVVKMLRDLLEKRLEYSQWRISSGVTLNRANSERGR